MPASVYFRLDRDVTPLRDHILVYNMEQGNKVSKGGIILQDDNGKEQGIRPRWCQVYKVGSNVDYVKPGEFVLIEHGRWTFGVPIDLDGKEIYLQRADPEGIMIATEECPDELKAQLGL